MPPQRITTVQFFLKTLSGFAGGITGTVLLLLIFIVGSSVLKDFFTPQNAEGVQAINPLFIFIYLAMIFLGSIGANISSCALIGLTEKTKYKRLNSSIYQIFIANIVLFIISAPIYIIAIGIDNQVVALITMLHVVLSVIMSSLILETIADSEFTLLGLYATIIAILGSTIINFILLQIINNKMILLFVGMPILWSGTGLSLGFVNIFYNVMYQSYGIDFLSQKINYGKDDITAEEILEETQKEEEKLEHKEKRNETGADFLDKIQ